MPSHRRVSPEMNQAGRASPNCRRGLPSTSAPGLPWTSKPAIRPLCATSSELRQTPGPNRPLRGAVLCGASTSAWWSTASLATSATWPRLTTRGRPAASNGLSAGGQRPARKRWPSAWPRGLASQIASRWQPLTLISSPGNTATPPRSPAAPRTGYQSSRLWSVTAMTPRPAARHRAISASANAASGSGPHSGPYSWSGSAGVWTCRSARWKREKDKCSDTTGCRRGTNGTTQSAQGDAPLGPKAPLQGALSLLCGVEQVVGVDLQLLGRPPGGQVALVPAPRLGQRVGGRHAGGQPPPQHLERAVQHLDRALREGRRGVRGVEPAVDGQVAGQLEPRDRDQRADLDALGRLGQPAPPVEATADVGQPAGRERAEVVEQPGQLG